jgi:archaemetzincin
VADPEQPKNPPGPIRRGTRFSTAAYFKRQHVFTQVQGDQAFARLGEPRPGDWLWSFREPGQTLTEYARQLTNRKSTTRHTLHLLAFDDLSPVQRRVLRPLEAFTSIYFQVPVRRLPTRKLRGAWYTPARRQYKAYAISNDLAKRVPADSLGLFGLLGADIYTPDLNFVFGLALVYRKASVHSLHRYGTDERKLLWRTLKLSAHELGHLLGLSHCVYYECVMNGVNSLREGDSKPIHLCPVCLAKLKWNLGFDPAARYRALGDFYQQQGLDAEARFVRARAPEVGSSGLVRSVR